MREMHHIDQGFANISIKTQIGNMFSFTGHEVSVTTLLFLHKNAYRQYLNK